MSLNYRPVLAVHFIWNIADCHTVDPILGKVRETFARDVDRPFSRGLNIPLFFFSSLSKNNVPAEYPGEIGIKNVVFIFCSKHTIGIQVWADYIKNLPVSDNIRYVPISVDIYGLNQSSSGVLKGLNFIRMYDFQESKLNESMILNIAHEVYRHGLIDINNCRNGKQSSVKLFLSHAKHGDTGEKIAKRVKQYIDNTNMTTFFDASDISCGFKFDEEIKKHLSESTLVIIGSDFHSSRYWCQREVLYAKESDRPIVVVNCLEQYEDRLFPATSNVPCVHVTPEIELNDSVVLRILTTAILETLRFKYVEKSLNESKKNGWINANVEISCRPPEVHQVAELFENKKNELCYPEPPVYSEEAEWISKLGIKAYTPLWKPEDATILKDYKIGLSISDFDIKGYSNFHMHGDQLKRLSQDLARHFLARSGKLIYGGDLRPDGFTQFILDEAVALKNRLESDNIHIKNYLAWPIYMLDEDITTWIAKYCAIMETEKCGIPSDIGSDVDENVYVKPDCVVNKYYWSRCLTTMREKSINDSTARICAGGKTNGYKGKMPGVLEEIFIALTHGKPLFLLGGFGGITKAVCNSIFSKNMDKILTEKWQIENNIDYASLQNHAGEFGHSTDYQKISLLLTSISIDTLAKRAGLATDEYKKLMESPFVEECIYLIIKGLRNRMETK